MLMARSKTYLHINKDIICLKTKFGVDNNLPIENYRLPNVYWVPKMHKNPIKARFIIASFKSSIKSIFRIIKA